VDWKGEATGSTDEEREHRRHIATRFEHYKSMAKEQFPNVRVLLAFHLAPNADVCEKILQGNFADLSSNDAGYFGQGIYLTTSVEYATRFYNHAGNEELHLIFCAVVIGNSFPVLECPFVNGDTSKTTGLYGKPIRAKSDSHIVIVSSDPVANHGLKAPLPAPPAHWPHSRTYTEIAVGSASQILPLGYAVLTMNAGKKKEVEDIDAQSMSGLGIYQQSANDPKLAMTYFNKAVALSPERSKHLHLAQRAKLHLKNQRPNSAIEDLEAAIVLQPQWYEGLEQMAAAYEGAERWVQALKTYQAIVAARPGAVGEMYDKMNVVAQRLVEEVGAMQQRTGSALVKAAKQQWEQKEKHLLRLEGENKRLEQKEKQWEEEKKQWELKEKKQWGTGYPLSIMVEGQEEGDPMQAMMGVYEVVEGKEVNARGVWKWTGQEKQAKKKEMFIYYASNGDDPCRWTIATQKSMEEGVCFQDLYVDTTALTPDLITETWKVWSGSGKGWPDAPKVRARVPGGDY
jgi:tetratricopeptide (TPR) repeat protein